MVYGTDTSMIIENKEATQEAKDEKPWDYPWTTDEIRKNSANWSLAGDVGLFNLLNKFSHNIISRTHEMENTIDSLVYKTKIASVKINNVINDFHMLSNMQFVENRVYDEGVLDATQENTSAQEKTKEQKEADMLPRIIKAVELGLSVLDQAFDKINVDEISDSEDEDLSSEGRTILEPKDPYENRPLPFIIGSQEFQNSDSAGLHELVEEETEASVENEYMSQSEETSSDEEEPLPMDDTSSSRRLNERKAPETLSNRLSSSDESELFGSSKEENGFLSDTSETKESLPGKDLRQDSVASIQSKLKLPQVLPTPQKQAPRDHLFSNDAELSDDSSPFRKKTGLFTSDAKFEDDKDLFSDDLFGSKTQPRKVLPTGEIKTLVKQAEKSELFDDDDSEEDIFNTLSSKKAQKKNAPKTDSPEKESADSLFGETDDLFANKKTALKTFDFDKEDDEEDLFGFGSKKNKKTLEISKKSEKKTALFEDSLDLDQETKSKAKKPSPNLFSDSDSSDKELSKKSLPPKKGISLFDDEDDDIFAQPVKTAKLPPLNSSGSLFNQPKEAKKQELSETEDDLFGSTLESQIRKDDMKAKMKNPTVCAPTLETKNVKEDEQVKANNTTLFEPTLEKKPLTLPLKSPSKVQPSLFEDSDDFDLFSPKSPVKKPQSPQPIKKPETQIDESTPEIPVDFSKSLKLETKIDVSTPEIAADIPKPVTISSEEPDDSIVDFDVPADSIKTLNVINKDRIKVAAKRRNPTRKGRLAALESNTDSTITSSKFVDSRLTTGVDLFSSIKPAEVTETITHKQQEKKKKDLMSQLMSEVTLSGIGRKQAVDADEEADIFPKSSTKDNDLFKSDFLFSPTENVSDQQEKPEDKKEKPSIIDPENSENDDFFTDNAFQGFKISTAHKDSILDLDDDDDLFKTVPKIRPNAADSGDIFADEDDDIFADIQKEKYEMFPSQVYDDDDEDDIFGGSEKKPITKSATASTSKPEAEVKAKPLFTDPLTGLLDD